MVAFSNRQHVYALLIAILTDKSADSALADMGIFQRGKYKRRKKYNVRKNRVSAAQLEVAVEAPQREKLQAKVEAVCAGG